VHKKDILGNIYSILGLITEAENNLWDVRIGDILNKQSRV
jgi:hypothetical protein